MPLFSRFKNKGAQPVSKPQTDTSGLLEAPPQPRYVSNWNSKLVVPEEVQELVHACTAEMKSRAEALDSPFLLLPFRPNVDTSGARSFIGSFFRSNHDGSNSFRGTSLQQELRLTEPTILCSIMKWCWSRMPGGVVSWPVYEGFQIGEKEANQARNAFETFIPISADSPARNSIIFDFFDLLTAVAAHGKMNGLGGRKLSRLAAWWAFELSDDGKGFEGGYKSWSAAADASSHLFFAYLRTLSPEEHPSMSLIERIPRSLQALMASTEYPPETPTLMQKSTPRVVMLVDAVSPTPFALLRRAKHFEYRSSDKVLRKYQEFEDPVDALTEECKRVLFAISNTNSSAVKSRHRNAAQREESWSAFQTTGFGDWDAKTLENGANGAARADGSSAGSALRTEPRSRDVGRPTTPSWADFMSSGFTEDDLHKPATTLLLPPDKQLPPLGSRVSTPSYIPEDDEHVAPGELAAIANVELDDAFWWVWMSSLAGEEPAERKAVFGRCAVIETTIHGRWLIMEEQIKGASPDPTEGAYIAKKKSFFSTFTRKGRLSRKQSHNKVPPPLAEQKLPPVASPTPSRRSLAPDQQSKIKEAAAALKKQESKDEDLATRRGRLEEGQANKTNSVLTVGLQSEAGPAMKWTSAYDKSTVRAQYLGDPFAGKGISREDLRQMPSPNLNGYQSSLAATSAVKLTPDATPVLTSDIGHDLSAQATEPTMAPASVEPERVVASSVPETQSALAAPVSSEDSSENAVPMRDDSEKEYVLVGGALAGAAAGTAGALEKDTSAEEGSPLRRKPVPLHPGLRPTSEDEPNALPPTPTSPAAIAAQRAMAINSNSPELAANNSKLKKQQGGGGGLKKLFGRKSTQQNRQSFDIRGSLAPPADSTFPRKLSFRKKKSTTDEPQNPSAMEMMHPNASELEAEPVMPSSFGAYQHSSANISHNDSVQDANPEQEFARFDQDASEIHPATIASAAQVSNPDLIAPQAQRNFNNVDQHLASQEAAAEREGYAGDAEDDVHSEASVEERQESPTDFKDRWATIRENAARRAAARASEEHSVQSRPSQSVRTEDDGETSGEETIESRVARIKARVAELTGGVDRR